MSDCNGHMSKTYSLCEKHLKIRMKNEKNHTLQSCPGLQKMQSAA